MITIRKMLSLDDNAIDEYEIIGSMRCIFNIGIPGTEYHKIKRRGGEPQYYFFTTELNRIIEHIFLKLDPQNVDLQFENQVFHPALSIVATIPEELQQIIPPIFFKWKEEREKEERRKKEEERKRKEEEERRKKEEERKRKEEEKRRKEEEERKRKVLMESPKRVLKLLPDCPDWLVEIYWRALVKEIHPDRHNGASNKEHLTRMLSLVNEAHDKIKSQRGQDWNPKKVPWKEWEMKNEE